MTDHLPGSITHDPKIQVVVTDARVFVSSHCWNTAACISVTATVQTVARVLAFQALLTAPVELTQGDRPTYDIQYKPELLARQAIAGLVSSLAGISRTHPDTIMFSDNRQTTDVEVPLPPSMDDSGRDDLASGSFAESAPVRHLMMDGTPVRLIS